MTERYLFGGKFTSQELFEMASEIKDVQQKEGKNLSPNLCAVETIKNTGITIIEDVLEASEANLYKESVENLFNDEINPNDRLKFLEGVGGVLLASIAQSLHDSVSDGWNDERFPATFNEAIRETAITELNPEDFHDSTDKTYQETTETISRNLVADPSFFSFFAPNKISGGGGNQRYFDVRESQLLPSSIVNFFKNKHPMWTFAFGQGLKAYKKAIGVDE